jgi:hypothetical protein
MTKARHAILISLAFLLSGCASYSPVPSGYSGSLAIIQDTMKSRSRTSVDLFYLEKIDGKTIDNSLSATVQANSGRGLMMEPRIIERSVPTVAGTFTIVGRTHRAAPILELAEKVYRVSGDVRFTPQPDHRYILRGSLDETHSEVWIEDMGTGEIMDRKIEVDGSSALGFFEK